MTHEDQCHQGRKGLQKNFAAVRLQKKLTKSSLETSSNHEEQIMLSLLEGDRSILLIKKFNGPTPASFCSFSVFQTNNTIFTTNRCEKMSIQYMAPGFEPSNMSSHIHQTRAPALSFHFLHKLSNLQHNINQVITIERINKINLIRKLHGFFLSLSLPFRTSLSLSTYISLSLSKSLSYSTSNSLSVSFTVHVTCLVHKLSPYIEFFSFVFLC